MRSSRWNPVILAAALAAAANSGLVLAVDVENRIAPGAGPGAASEDPSVGGPFSLELKNVSFDQASVGGPYRLVSFLGPKAASDVFSDSFESGDTSGWSATVPEVQFPSGAIIPFDLEQCPAGWFDADNSYRGRTLVGLLPGGTLRGGTQSGWTGENDTHYHYPDFTVVTDSRGHNHHWATLVNASIKTWQTLSATSGTVNMISWNDGIGNEGSGYYLLAATPGDWLFTANTSHNHPLTFDNVILDWDLEPDPNVQLRFCRKE